MDVALIETRQRDPSRFQQIDLVLGDQALALSRGHAREGEHADLVGDVVPRARRPLILQAFPQDGSHLQDAVGHGLELHLPLSEALGFTQHLLDEKRTMLRWIRVHGPDHHLQLRGDHLCLGRTATDSVQATDALAYKSPESPLPPSSS